MPGKKREVHMSYSWYFILQLCIICVNKSHCLSLQACAVWICTNPARLDQKSPHLVAGVGSDILRIWDCRKGERILPRSTGGSMNISTVQLLLSHFFASPDFLMII